MHTPVLALGRIALGGYLVWHYVTLLPWAAETYGASGVLADPSANPLPSPWSSWIGAPGVATLLIATLALVAVAYAVGLYTRAAGVALWVGALALWLKNQLTYNPTLPFLGFWFLAQCFLPPNPPLSIDRWLARGRAIEKWQIPADLAKVLWIVTGVAYTYSGYTKLCSSSWRNGRAVSLLLESPLARSGGLVDAALALPTAISTVAAFAVLSLEVAYLPLALFPRARPYLWLATMAMHASIASTMNIAGISLGMIAFHAMLFDPEWITRLSRGAHRSRPRSVGQSDSRWRSAKPKPCIGRFRSLNRSML